MKDLDPTRLEGALTALGDTLSYRGRTAAIAVIGGSGLLLLRAIQRTTQDVDIVALVDGLELRTAEPLPEELREAARDVARALDLPQNWLNPGPTALLEFGLPQGYLGRSETRRFGALLVYVASRIDQVHFKLYAAVDHGPRSKHMEDLRALAPSRAELVAAAQWCRTHDPSPAFLGSVRSALRAFGVEVGDDGL